ncbi:hypothetical protein GCK72_003837 [Caenorhabditis remanei]|uniref:C-type lectin domain-containing protein n=1 Tax=Caenorhabditis remanei TaxID=31234 RepID=A0A6A5HAK4_CAERE|nr:hypothetical protein GCK72_003837 [Caenorhabditis remanei]KAF1763891.1 hypothetical protein GCK72_003837 [Caenorhabditis remanei]
MKPLLILLPLLAYTSFSTAEKVCASGFKMVNNRCLALVRQYKSYSNAEKVCRFNGGAVMGLAKNAVDNRALVQFLQDAGVSTAWLGLMCGGGKCQWDDVDMLGGYNNFNGGIPSGDVCVQLNVGSGKWQSESCDKTLPFVCELQETQKDCHSNCDYNYQNHCYTLVKQQKNFQDAENHCKSINAHMTSIHSFLEYRFVAQLYADWGLYWLGGTLTSANAKIKWLDGSSDDFETTKYHKDGNCLQYRVDSIGIGHDWFAENCGDESIFICKRPASC